MKFSTLQYYIKEGFTGLLKNRLMTMASMAAVAACIFIFTFSYCLLSNLNYMLTQIEDSIGIAVFLEDGLTSEDVKVLNEKISAFSYVKQVTYTSPEQALETLKEQWKMSDALEGFDAENNPLSSSFEIELNGVEYQSQAQNDLKELAGIRNIRQASSETDFLMKLRQLFGIAGLVVIVILSAISVVIIMNTIKISVYTRKTEINIMKFVGATDWFIRWPFIIEGILIGMFGAAIPMLISWPAYDKMVEVIYSYIPIIKNLFVFHPGAELFTILLPLSLGAGVFLGVAGSVTSIRKYLRV